MKRKNFFSRNGLKFYALISLLLLCNIGISAQTGSKAVKVTISPQTGNIISVRSESSQEAGSRKWIWLYVYSRIRAPLDLQPQLTHQPFLLMV